MSKIILHTGLFQSGKEKTIDFSIYRTDIFPSASSFLLVNRDEKDTLPVIITFGKRTIMRNYMLLMGAGLAFLASCGNHPSGIENSVVPTDTVVTGAMEDPELELLLPLFKEVPGLPLTIDSSYIASITEGDSLIGERVKLLDVSWIKHDLTDGLDYELREFYKIDSLEHAGAFSNYLEDADIGMTVSATVYPGHRLLLNDGTELLTWAYSLSSYPACPYSAGTYVFYSLLYKGSVTESFLIGEDYGAGDPPVAMEVKVNSVIFPDGKITISLREVHSDMDQPEMEVKKGEFVLQVNQGKSIMKKEDVIVGKEPNPDGEQ